MKISRKDLRRIILENILNEKDDQDTGAVNLNKAWRAGKKYVDNKSDDNKDDVELFVKKLENDKRSKKGPYRKEGDRARAAKADGVLTYLQDLLTGKNTPAPTEPAAEPNAEETASTSPEKKSAEWVKYGNENDWEYKIQGASPNEIWVTRKANGSGSGKVYELNQSKYAVTVKKLDAYDKEDFPKRSDASKKNDPALTSIPKSNQQKSEKIQPTPGKFIDYKNSTYRYDTNAGHVNYFQSEGYTNFNLNKNDEKSLVQIISGSDRLMLIGESGLQLMKNGKNADWSDVVPGQAQTNEQKKKIEELYKEILANGKVYSNWEPQNESFSHGSLIRQRYRRY